MMNVKMASTQNRESPETSLSEWMLMYRRNQRLRAESYTNYYKRFTDTCTFSTTILGSKAGIVTIVLAIEPILFLVVNIAQICLSVACLANTAIITASNHLEFEKKTP
jgi:hypothetical protein